MKSYLKFLSRNKLYTAIEAVGLVVSLAFVILLGTYIWQQYGVINENPDTDRIYVLGWANGSTRLSHNEKRILQNEPVPEIEVMARYSLEWELPMEINGEQMMPRVAIVDKEWFEIFPYYEMETGSVASFNSLDNAFISRSFANTLGTDEEVLGMTILDIFEEKEYVVAGIMEDFRNTLFQSCDIIINARSMWPDNMGIEYSMLGGVYTFIRLQENADVEEAGKKMSDILKSAAPYVFSSPESAPALYTIEDAFYDKNGFLTSADRTMIRVLVIIVLSLLVSAILNYINLSFALVTKRAKEMATRRLVGANTRDILRKCITESVCFTVVCFGAAVLAAIVFEPLVNSLLIGENPNSFVPIDIPLRLGYVTVCIFTAVILGVLVGIVPSVSASAFSPIDVVKGEFRARNKMVFSKIFIVIQNTMAVILISMGVLMEAQLSHMINIPKNSNTDNLFYLETWFLESPDMAQPMYDALMKNPDVKRVGFGTCFPYYINFHKDYLWVNAPEGEVRPLVMTCDSVYFDMLKPIIIEDLHSPLIGSLWLSESASNAMQLTDNTASAIFNSPWFPCTDHLGGTYKDIPTSADNVGISVIEVVGWNKLDFPSIIIETVSESVEIRKSIMDIYEKFSEECTGIVLATAMSGFISELHETMMAPTVRFIRLVEIFMVLSIILSVMGMVAMSTYFSEQKSKEIAVRKVFGGTVLTETLANLRNYMLMVLTSCVIGVPIAVYLTDLYLEQFAYRIGSTW